MSGPATAPAGTTASASAGATASGSAQAYANAAVMTSKAFHWNELTVRSSDVSDTRAMFRSPTAVLDELEMHATTLKPGQRPHAPHQHAYEEMVVMREGTLEATVNGKVIVLAAGSVLYVAPNDLHGWQNTGAVPATYFIITWKTPRSAAATK
jgi:quercetin dioxygenase-like cupin family protein